tara:strand:+ start:2985 stop:3908 length:924 start_codon:yes stop_codon:yes gene_type:complete
MDGLQAAEGAFQEMLSGESDTQQELETDTGDENFQDSASEIEEEEISEEINESAQEPEPTYYQVQIDGEQHEVTLDEALKGYQRQSHFTRSTQKLAEERKAFEAEQQALRQERDHYSQQLNQILSQQQNEPEPDWDQLYENDPLEWMKQKESFRDRKEQMQNLQLEQQQLMYRQQQEQAQAQQAHLQQQQATLIDAIPEWRDPQVAQAEKAGIRDYAKSLGWQDSEIQNISDFRAVLALRQGWKAQSAMERGKTKIRQVPEGIRPVSPGSAQQQPRQHTQVAKARMKLAKSGSMKDAEAVFKNMFTK